MKMNIHCNECGNYMFGESDLYINPHLIYQCVNCRTLFTKLELKYFAEALRKERSLYLKEIKDYTKVKLL